MTKPHLKALAFALALAIACVTACTKPESGGLHHPTGASTRGPSHGHDVIHAILTKEEVGAVLGKPVTSMDGKGTNLNYKTEVAMLETNVEIEQKDDEDDAVRALQGARTATGMLGGKAETVAGLGDEAIFGAMSLLYVRKGDVLITVTPPNLQQVAGMAAYGRVTGAALGSEEQLQALRNLQQVERTDPMQAGLKSADDMQGAVATIKAVSKKQNTDYESNARAMALALATKVLQKL
jgi:hypothetical protein